MRTFDCNNCGCRKVSINGNFYRCTACGSYGLDVDRGKCSCHPANLNCCCSVKEEQLNYPSDYAPDDEAGCECEACPNGCGYPVCRCECKEVQSNGLCCELNKALNIELCKENEELLYLLKDSYEFIEFNKIGSDGYCRGCDNYSTIGCVEDCKLTSLLSKIKTALKNYQLLRGKR